MVRRRSRTFGLAMVLVVAVVALLAWRLNQSPAAAPASQPTEEAGPDPAAWTSVGWRLVANPFAQGDPKPKWIEGLTQAPGLLVAWGRVEAVGRNQFNDEGAIFVSGDGVNWRAVTLDDGVGAGDTSEPHGVATGPLGLLAWGGVCCGVEEPALWRSDDGSTWTRLKIAVPPPGIVDVVGRPGGWVAVGVDRDQSAIWTSDDGQTWRKVDLGAEGRGKGVIWDVAVAGDRYIAVGTIEDAGGTHDGAVWTSNDGMSWSRIAAADPTLIGPDETELSRVVPFGTRLFMIGNHGSHEERVQCEKLTGALASFDEGPPQTALSCGWGREHHWLSEDGSSWRRLAPLDPLPGEAANPAARPLEFRLLIPAGQGLIDLAEDNRPPAGDTAIWISGDGTSWRSIPAGGQVPPAGAPAGSAMADGRLVVVGEGNEAGNGIAVRTGLVR